MLTGFPTGHFMLYKCAMNFRRPVSASSVFVRLTHLGLMGVLVKRRKFELCRVIKATGVSLISRRSLIFLILKHHHVRQGNNLKKKRVLKGRTNCRIIMSGNRSDSHKPYK